MSDNCSGVLHATRRIVMLAFLLLPCLALEALAQQVPASPAVPRQFHYQGCLTDATGNRISGTKDITFQLVDLDTNPLNTLFTETAVGVPVTNGIFEHNIGSINSLPPLIFQKRVGILLWVDGESLTPPIPILPSPVAMVALYADSLKYPVEPGLHCWDLDGDGEHDPGEDTNGDGSWDADDCRGPAGPMGAAGPAGPMGAAGPAGPAGPAGANGANGINCWDTNGNGMNDPGEDTNGDGAFDANDCKGPKGDPGPPGGSGSDTVIVKNLIVEGWSSHAGNEHFRRGITVGGPDSARAALRIDSTGEIYARSLHIIDPRFTGLFDQNRVVEFDSTGSVHRMPERYITFNPQDPKKSDTTIVTGERIRTPVLEIFDPQNPDSLGAMIARDGEGYFRSLHVVDANGNPLVNFNRDGTSEHSGLETYYGGIRVLLETGDFIELTPFGIIMPLVNGNYVEISPFDGISIKDPNNPTNPYVSHIDPSGNSLFTGQKNAIVETRSFGVRKMYVEEATELWFNDRGTGRLVNGRAVIALDPMFLEVTHIDASHPIIVKITPTADCNGMFVAEKAGDHFVVKELMDGSSDATFDWEVNAKRIQYEQVRMERFEPANAVHAEDAR